MPRKTTSFEQLEVWQKSRSLAGAIYKVSSQGSFARDFGLRDQLRRAAVSVMSNIAEGFGRFTRPEFRRFVVIARGSAAEVQSQLYLARDRLPPGEHQDLPPVPRSFGCSGIRASPIRTEERSFAPSTQHPAPCTQNPAPCPSTQPMHLVTGITSLRLAATPGRSAAGAS